MDRKCKVLFPLSPCMLDADVSWPPLGTQGESLWGEWTGTDTARLLNSPFYVKGIAYLDEVRVKKAEVPAGASESDVSPDFVEFDSVVSRAGHGTVRVILVLDEALDEAEQVVADMNKMGCTWESSGDAVSIDIPPEADQHAIMKRLDAVADKNGVYVDVGFLAKP